MDKTLYVRGAARRERARVDFVQLLVRVAQRREPAVGLRCILNNKRIGIAMRKAFYLLIVLALLISSCNNSSDAGQEPDETIVYFLVTEKPGFEYHEDSYVVGISDPTDIEYARRLISANGEDQGQGTIIVCEIAAGSDGINRDFLSNDKSLWSWHVVKFLEFAHMTAEILDGWPSYVESNVAGWINNTNGEIGFWGYTITRELDESELEL